VQRRHVRGEVSGVHTLDTKDANIALFDVCDEVRDSELAKVHSRQVVSETARHWPDQQRLGWQSNIAPTLLIGKN
jgi:hypothetical protein